MALTATAQAVLQAREILAQATEALNQAEANFKLDLAKAGTDFAIVDGVKVAVIKGERPSYDAEALKALVSDKTFKMVTKATVDGKKFKSALDLGTIKADIAEAVTKVTAYEQIRVTEVKADKRVVQVTAQVA